MKTVIENWLKLVIRAHEELYELSSGPYGTQLTYIPHYRIQLYSGLETLAHQLRATITYNPVYDDCVGKMSVNYKGYEIFELWKKEERNESNIG